MNRGNSSLSIKLLVLDEKELESVVDPYVFVIRSLRCSWSYQWRLHSDCSICNKSTVKHFVLYPSVCGYEGVWEDHWCTDDESCMWYTSGADMEVAH